MQLKVYLLILIFSVTQCLDMCKIYQSYQSCIASSKEICIWNDNLDTCQRTYDYIQGCNIFLNKRACVEQIGNNYGQLAKCRFISVCEVIPNLKTENCLNNLSKSGCLSIQNTDVICIWKDDQCNVLPQNQWSEVEENFDTWLLSASACSLIENYLAIHNTILWVLLQYVPDLQYLNDLKQQQEFGIVVDEQIDYDDPELVSMRNNYLQSDGKFIWYKYRVSNSITLSKLRKNYRYREGCIALEIENDEDFLNIFSLEGEVRGINHVYCKYLNSNPFIKDKYIFSNKSCQIFLQDNLDNQQEIQKYNLDCHSLDQLQCIYFDSISIHCKILTEEYLFPCVPIDSLYLAQSIYLTVQQCKDQDLFYLNYNTNLCVNDCLQQSTQLDCENANCIYLGNLQMDLQYNCIPQQRCNQKGLGWFACLSMKDKCKWDSYLKQCYQINDEEIQYLSCNDAFNMYMCSQVTLSDQKCYFYELELRCINILDHPFLMTFNIFYDANYTPWKSDQSLMVSNINLCKSNDYFPIQYNLDTRKCQFDDIYFTNDFTLVNKYRCLYNIVGICIWNEKLEICQCFSEDDIQASYYCSDLQNVQEIVCQYAKVINQQNYCIYDNESQCCKEMSLGQINELGCQGNGLARDLCVSISQFGRYCQYQAGLCLNFGTSSINSSKCVSIQNVNNQICRLQSIDQVTCIYDSNLNACYSPNYFNNIKYNQYLNRAACSYVSNGYTYFNPTFQQCVSIENDSYLLYKLQCEDSYVNIEVCKSIKTSGQYCYWNDNLLQCQNYPGYFNKCGDYQNASTFVCSALQTTSDDVLMKDHYCSFTDGKCKANIQSTVDCGEEEIMNIHRCSGMTGINQNGEFVQMCAFINKQCIQLEADSMNTYILLNQISCEQANFKTCTLIQTKNQLCQTINPVSNNNIIDKKCKQINNNNLTCEQIPKNIVNPNFCSLATNSCQFDQNQGCITPLSVDLNCDTIGLSKQGCINNTNNHRCAFSNLTCKFYNEQDQNFNCQDLNQFSCESYKYQSCQWNIISNSCNNSDENFFNSNICSQDTNLQFKTYTQSECQIIDNVADQQEYTCDSVGINQFACQSFSTQFCLFEFNKCQFSLDILCEDRVNTCISNYSLNRKCVLKNGNCIEISHSLFECDYFEQTNYQFCLQYPNCIYYDNKCQQRIQNYNMYYCQSFWQGVIECTINNFQYSCSFDQEYESCESFQRFECPSLNGYYSMIACQLFQNCEFGYTKSGKGFCYLGSFEALTCEELPINLCIENLSHLNSNLKCYWNDSCITISNEFDCFQLSNYQSNYAACISLNDNFCIYSHQENKCKYSGEYVLDKQNCEGTNRLMCSQIKLECYYDGQICSNSGTLEQINKYGCISKDGNYLYQNFQCSQISQDTYLVTCENISYSACLSSITREIFCRWKDDKCQTVYKNQNKRIDSCLDLNQNVCRNVRLSNVQCYWNNDENKCLQINIDSFDCSLSQAEISTSISLCSSQIGSECVRNFDKKGCQQITVEITQCDEYGINQEACIKLTKNIACQWLKFENGGFCESPNLLNVNCGDNLNQLACLNVKQIDQFCFWDNQNSQCISKSISDCESASYLNGDIPCKAVISQSCIFDSLTSECKKIDVVNDCASNYNFVACKNSSQFCYWNQNLCISEQGFQCGKALSKKQCLRNDIISCQWSQDKCLFFPVLMEKIQCVFLPINISQKACASYAFDDCTYEEKYDKCIPNQPYSSFLHNYKSILDLLNIYYDDYYQPLLQSDCDQLETKEDCINSRNPNQKCIWIDNCQILENSNQANCKSNLNIYACLAITTEKQYCFWRNKCLDWDQSLNIWTNVNINVCKDFSINRIYYKNSCKLSDIEDISCASLGISKITCLSILNYPCVWNEQENQCQLFQFINFSKCQDLQKISPKVCQLQQNLSCIYDELTKGCKDADLNLFQAGISMKACFLIQSTATFWNGDYCAKLTEIINCDQQIKVNSIACQNVLDKACIYDNTTNTCTSVFNINSLTCNTQGINLIGCASVLQEPCIFIDAKCIQFYNFNSECINLKNVNAKTCASIEESNCYFNTIGLSCRSPVINIDYCNKKGINKSTCNLNDYCLWNQDNLSCKCKNQQNKEQCYFLNSAQECRSNQNCYFYLNQCIQKQCYHLSQSECQLQTLDGKICYLSKNDVCQSAAICEDITNSKLFCSNIYIDSNPCVQAGSSCVSLKNYEKFCPYSDCTNTNCFYEQGHCRNRLCSDNSAIQCYQQSNCFLDKNNYCKEFITCSQISKDTFGELASSICNQLISNGFKCNWQKQSFLDNEEICTNQPCEIYGQSKQFCQGNEMNNYVCVLTSDLICKQCEQITEQCFCDSQVNTCTFKDGKCQSIICSSFDSIDKCTLAQGRCYWSYSILGGTTKSQGCIKECVKIVNLEECENRINECYYDQIMQICKKGKKTIPNLSVNFTIEEFYGKILYYSFLLAIQFFV